MMSLYNKVTELWMENDVENEYTEASLPEQSALVK